MKLPAAAAALLPARSSGDVVAVSLLGSELARSGVSYWRQLGAGRRFPAMPSLMSCLSPAMRDHAALVAVLEGGADYEYRQVGAAMAKAFDEDFTGKRVSDLMQSDPRFGVGVRMLYEMVRASGEPLGYRGWAGRDLRGAAFIHHESAILPLGENDAVDHLLVVSSLVMRGPASA